MTRPGYNRRPSLPCADSVALMAHVMPVDMIGVNLRISAEIANTPLGADDHQMCWLDLRPAARRLTLYPWYFGGAH